MASDKKYYRSIIPGLQVVVGDPDPTKGEVAHPTVKFTPYWEYKKGVEGRVKVGYLATSNGSAQKKISNDVNVVEIDRKTFEEATEPSFDSDGEQVTGVKAPN